DPGWAAIRKILPEAEESLLVPSAEQLLLESQTLGRFGSGISRMMLTLFGGSGLIVVEPRQLRGSAVSSKVFAREVAAVQAERQEVLASHRQVLEAGYRPQLPEPVAGDMELFQITPRGGRERIDRPLPYLLENRKSPDFVWSWKVWGEKIVG